MEKENPVKLDDMYDRVQKEGAENFYRSIAKSYDADNAALGYRPSQLGVAFLARYLPPNHAPILDAGVGTGQVGSALKVLGYENITGVDLSEDMLSAAKETGAYAHLVRHRLGERLHFETGSFAAVICIGCFGPGHAPPETLYEFVRIARPDAPIVFNLVEKTWREQGFPEILEDIVAQNLWTLLEDRHGWRTYAFGEPDHFSRMFVFKATGKAS